MARQATTTAPASDAKRAARTQRILDAAAELILRWGYNKTTIDDIARQAGVAKGTIYLHWKTREDLFAALMLRERVALSDGLKQRLALEPDGANLRGLMRHSALALMERPLLKAVLLGDAAIIGKLAHNPDYHGMYVERFTGFKGYLEILRAAGRVRTDIDIDAQVYMIGAIFAGFFLLDPLVPDEMRLPDPQIAELLAETVHRTLEVPHTDAASEPAVAAAFDAYIAQATENTHTRLKQGLKQERPGEEHAL